MSNIQTLKAHCDFKALVQETHSLVKGKLHCLWHEDKTPSLHIYSDGYHCFACGAHGDHIDWLMTIHHYDFAEAVRELECKRQNLTPQNSPQKLSLKSKPKMTNKPNHAPLVRLHQQQVSATKAVPEALKDHGFSLGDCRRLGIANVLGNAEFPIIGAEGQMLAIKCRYGPTYSRRYAYISQGQGTPAWCSSKLKQQSTFLIMEGELNAMMTWLALGAEKANIGLIGVAGVHGAIPIKFAAGKQVYLYADSDEAGQHAVQRWANQAHQAGASQIFLLKPWAWDACEMAGRWGKARLKQRLRWAKTTPFTPPLRCNDSAFDVHPAAAKSLPTPPLKPDLKQTFTQYQELGQSDVPRLP